MHYFTVALITLYSYVHRSVGEHTKDCSIIIIDHTPQGVDCRHRDLLRIPSGEEWHKHLNIKPTDVKMIYFADNLLENLTNDGLKDFPNLIHLSIDRNRLKYVANNTFDGLESLEYLSLFQNEIENLSSDLFSKCCPKLRYLDIGANMFNSLPDSIIRNLSSLESLKMQEISYPESIVVTSLPDGFRGHPRLTNITMTGFNMSIMDQNFFKVINKSVVQYLDLSANGMINVHPQTFDGLTNLKNLTLNLNTGVDSKTLSNITRSLNISKLCYFSCRYCEGLKHITDDTFSSLKNTSLRVLHLSSTHIKSLAKDSFKQLLHLEELYLADNNVSDLYPELFFGPKKSLRILDLSDSPRLTNTSSATGNLTRLTLLDISGNPSLQRLDGEAHNGLSALKQYFLGDCNLETIENFSMMDMHNLEILDVSQNENLRLIAPSAFRNMSKLIHLYIDDTKISNLSMSHFEEMQHLTSISAASMELKDLPSDCFKSNTNLMNVVVTGNRISHINRAFANLKNLQLLSLGGNSISTVDSRAFEGCQKLQFLDLSSQRSKDGDRCLNRVPRSITDHLKHVTKVLHIDDNNITMFTISETDYFRDSALQDLHAGANPFDCQCDDHSDQHREFMYLLDWVSAPSVSKIAPRTNATYTCNTPRMFHNMNMFSSNFQGKCRVLFDWRTFISIFLPVLCITMVLAKSVIYVKRWSIMYYWCVYKKMLKVTSDEDSHLLDPRFDFDAIVCCGQDNILQSANVNRHDEIVRLFESRLGMNPRARPFRLCSQRRHFLLGHCHLEQMHRLMRRSRKVIIALTNSFIISRFGYFELEAAFNLRNHFNMRNVLILCVLEPLTKSTLTSPRMPTELTEMLGRGCFLEWPSDGNPDGERLFWLQLTEQLMKPSDS